MAGMAYESVDLHSHSTASDGTLPPEEVVRLAQRAGLVGLALTDHDTVAGIAAAELEARRLGIGFIAGIEISCSYGPPGTMHLLGYGVKPRSASLSRTMQGLVEARDVRNPRIIQRLNELGVAITMAEVEDAAGGGEVIGRPHIAAVLVRKGYVRSPQQAFERYLGEGAAAYFDKERLSARRAVELIHEAGGLIVLAHPVQLRTENDAQLDRVVKDLVDLGLDGIEVIHSDHDAAMIERYTKLADRYGLLKTGGSDFHGANKGDIQLGFVRGRRIPRRFYRRAGRGFAAAAQRGSEDVNETIDELDLEALNAGFAGQEPAQIMAWAAAQFGDGLVMSSSFGAESAVLVHLANTVRPGIRIIMVDTGVPVSRDAPIHGGAAEAVRPERVGVSHDERPDCIPARGRRNRSDDAAGRGSVLRHQ